MATVQVSRDGAVTRIMINRPQARNAVDPQTASELLEAVTAFEADHEAAVAVLAGAGGHFCAGFDLKALSGGGITHDPRGEGMMGPTRRVPAKPVIAAVEGYAVAGGLELALWCDMRVASETAIFGVYCRRWGVPLIDGGTIRLPRLIGESRAMDMILTGRPVDAQEALAFGLANRVVPAGEAIEAACALAAEIARFPQICLRADRASARAQWSETMSEALAREGVDGDIPLREEAVSGAARFAGGRGRGGDFGTI